MVTTILMVNKIREQNNELIRNLKSNRAETAD